MDTSEWIDIRIGQVVNQMIAQLQFGLVHVSLEMWSRPGGSKDGCEKKAGTVLTKGVFLCDTTAACKVGR